MVECCLCPWLKKKRESRTVVLIVVTVALFVDCILNTVIAPILPTVLTDSLHGKENTYVTSNSSAVSFVSNLSLFDNSSEGIYQEQNVSRKQGSGECFDQGNDNLRGENMQIGLLLAIKDIMQILANPIVGAITNKFGFDAPLLVGFAVVFASTLMYAFSEEYAFLCVARSLQGIGSSFTTVAGLALVANIYPDDGERANAMAIASSGLAAGALVGAPFGSLMNGFLGKSSPLLVIAAVTLLDGSLRLCIFNPTKFSPGSVPATPYRTLLTDPYILVTIVGYFLTKFSSGILQATLPIRMLQHMCAPSYQLGLALAPATITCILTLNGFAFLSLKWGRWLCILLGFIIQGIGIMFLPLAGNIFELIGPTILIGIGTSLVGASVIPLMAYLIDLRHTSSYGGIYAITDTALCLGFAVGPLFGGAIASVIGFTWLMVILGLLQIVYAPFFILLHNPNGKDEKQPILNHGKMQDEAKSDDH
ncbi:chromaffin granule amine transporter [Xenopus laevis]|uniref:Major facilitator superfamily (MFS) profile domain-containing protein n=2 Tax=Xenopus laevis TaxID=8355 RepID=A0A974HTR5_XENLA|nr:chromaffin granule amine transporter [Xenopus laevis]OCT90122.1 hypothetical protein XELAEV_18018738mg [Xenopus laevis]